MALNQKFTTDANNKVTGVTKQESEIEKSYNAYVANNPEPEYDYANPPAPNVAPEPEPEPESTPAPQVQDNSAVQATKKVGGALGVGKATTKTATDTESATPSWVMDAHFSQQYFLDEQQKRKNPDYVSEIADLPDAALDNIVLVIKGRQENHPDQWKYGDPGWKSDDPLWSEYIKPLEDAYQSEVRAQQTVKAQQASESAAREALANDKRFSKAIVDTSDADISTLSTTGKVFSYATPSYAGTDAKNQSGIAKYTQQFISSYLSGGGVAKGASMISGLLGGPVTGVNVVVHGLTSGYQEARNTGLIKPIKALDTIIEYSDFADEKMQNILGALAFAFEKTGGDDLYDPNQMVKSIKHIADNFGDIMHYAYGSGKASTEYPAAVVGAVTGMSANIAGLPLIGDTISRGLKNIISAELGDDEFITRYQTTRANSGLPGVYDLDEEMVGSNGIMFWMDLGKYLYDHGMTDEDDIKNEIQFMISQYYGDRATLSEYFEHEMVDPGNTVENMDSRVIGGYAAAIGKIQGIDPEHNNLLKAAKAQTGSWLGDLTGGIPVLPDLAREAGKALGKPNFMSTSGGMNEVFAQWHNENIMNDADDLTALDRKHSHITEDNKIDRVIPNPNSAKNVVERVQNAVHNFISETNESRAAYEGDAIFAYVDQGIEDAIASRGNEDVSTTVQRINKFVDELENPDSIDMENSPFADNAKSVLYNSIKDDLAEAVKARRSEINQYINRYFAPNLETNRRTLFTLSEALNLTPEQLLNKYTNDKVRLTQTIVNLAEKNGGKIPGIDIDVETKQFGDEVMKRIAPFAGDEGEPWDLRMLGVQISTSIADGVTDTLINKFGIKPDKFIYRFGDTIKKMQNLLLLGLSPSYLANNLVNNVATRTSLGYGGYMTPKTIGNWMKRFGYSPDRFADSLSNEIGQKSRMGGSKYEKLLDGIRGKKKVKDALEAVGSFSSKASSTVGIFGNISNWVESRESQQIVAAAMMNYMSRTWKKGVNFRRMPLEIEAAIEQQMPGMVNTIYSAISSGINMAEIEKAIFGTFIAPSIEDTLRTAAQRLGLDEELINEYFVKNGMLDQLQQALHGKQGSEIDDVIADFKERLKSILSIEFNEEIARRAETIGNQVTEEGFATAIDCAYDSADEWSDILQNTMDINSRIFQRRIEEGIPTKEFRKMYQEQQRNLTERWESVYKKAQQTFEGILRGIGIKDKNNSDYLQALNDKNNLWLNFYKKTQPELIKPYLDSLEWIEGDTRATWDSRVKKAWGDYLTAIESAVNDVYKAEADIQKRMDEAYLAGLKEAVGTERAGEIDAKFKPIFDKINAARADIIEQNKLVRKEANKTNELLKKNKAYLDAEEARKNAIIKYTEAQYELYEAIDSYRSIITNKTVQDVNTPVDHVGNIVLEVAEANANESQQEAENNSEQLTDAISEGADAEEADAYVRYSPELLEKLPSWAQNILEDKTDLAKKVTGIRDRFEFEFQDEVEEKIMNLNTNIRYKNMLKYYLNQLFDELNLYVPESVENKYKEAWLLDESSRDLAEFLIDELGNDLFKKPSFKVAVKFNDFVAEISEVHENFKDNIETLEMYTDIHNEYYVNRKNLVSVALRAGATEEVANAFSRYINLIADKWERNHKGLNFFRDADGIGGLRVHFGEYGGSQSGNYSYDDRMINIFMDADFFVLLHEMGHGLQYVLDEKQQREMAQYFGLSYEKYVWISNDGNWDHFTEEEKMKNFDIAESFARGFTDYLSTGDAPTVGMANIFKTFKKLVRDVFGDDVWNFVNEHLIYPRNSYATFANHDLGYPDLDGVIRANQERNNMTFSQILSSFTDTPESLLAERKEQSQIDFANGKFAPLEDISNFADVPLNVDGWITKGDAIAELAQKLFYELQNAVYPKDETNPNNMFAPPTIEELMQYLWQSPDEDGKYISQARTQTIDFLIQSLPDDIIWDQVQISRNNTNTWFQEVPSEGAYVTRCLSFDFGEFNLRNGNPIVAIIYEDGKPVAYVPSSMETWQIQDGDNSYQILGVSPENPEQWVYKVGNEIRTEKIPEEPATNPHSAEMNQGTMPTHDPTGDAHNKVAYENVFKILEEFGNLYKHDLTDNMSQYKFNNLNDTTKEFVRGYISRDVRQDLNNTKYKASKFGEMMRDAALLNYNQRYGFDNFFSLLCPYQFWQTRSVLNWITRMNTKGGKMWRKYYKLKEIARRNKKEFMPSKITEKFGIYIPGLPDWMGDAIFMSTDQLFVVNQFVEPLLKREKKKNSVLAAAEKFLQEEFEEGNITYEQYLAATNEETKENSPDWQAALAKAQLENDSDTGLGNLFEQYFGWNLPVSTLKALITGDQSGWNQWPITRTATAFRAVLGNNWVGKGGQMVLSAPEKALRKAAVDEFGDAFVYNEFGAFGNYYITQKAFDMVVEGEIEAADAVQAAIEKDGNAIWEKAADRQRQETLVKMQGGSVIDASKKLIKDWRAGDKAEDSIRDDIMYLFASIITAPMSKTIVTDAERTFRQDKQDLSKAYEAKAAGDKEAVNRYYDEHEYATYNNLRYEKDEETMLRQYLYKTITDKYYDLDKAERYQVSMSFGSDFQKYVLDKETQAIDAIDINKLAAYAQALNGKVPYLATDKLNTMNVQPAPIMPVQQTVLDEYNEYLKLRDELYPGMAKANSIYYDMPAEDRKYITKNNPDLAAYQKWDKDYKKAHENVKNFSSLISDSYDVREMEEFCANLDPLTMKHLKYVAYADKQPDKEYKMVVETLMQQMGITDKYDYFIKDLKKYILGE